MAEQRAPLFFVALMVIATLAIALVIAPIAKDLMLAAVLASMLWPVQQWLTSHLHGRRAVAASLIALAVTLLLLGPIAMLATFVIRDGADGVRFVSEAVRSDDVAAIV